MRIGVVSDSHGDLARFRAALEHLAEAEVLIHLGDHAWDMDRMDLGGRECYAVRGNTDGGSEAPEELLIHLGEVRVFLCHGHRYGVKQGLQRLYYRGLELEADLVLFGHTHQALSLQEGPLWMVNPGSLSRPYPGEGPSAALVTVAEGTVSVEILRF